MIEHNHEEIEYDIEELTVIMAKQLNQVEGKLNIMEHKLNVLGRALNTIKIGGTFILLIVFFDYLADTGWFGSRLEKLSNR